MNNPTHTTNPREFAVEATVIITARDLHDDPSCDTALDDLAALLRDAAKAGEADVVLTAIGAAYSGNDLWECVKRAEALEAVANNIRPDGFLTSIRDTHIPALAAATATWCMNHELPVIERPDDGHLSGYLRRSVQEHHTAKRVAEIISWGAYSLQRADLIADRLPLCPRASHLPLLRRYLTLRGPEHTVELAERLAPELLEFAVSAIKAEAAHAA
jgi:hypothetical protein